MITYLTNYLQQTIHLPGTGMFYYISFRTILAFITALAVSAIFGRKIIDVMKRRQIGETVRKLGLPGEETKKGTPTMGGVIIVLGILFPTLLFGDLSNVYIRLMIITTVWMGTIGFLDDYLKMKYKNKVGLKGKFKILGQVGLGLIVGIVMWNSSSVVIRENVEVTGETYRVEEVNYKKNDVKSTKTTIPFVKNNNLDYADAFRWLGDEAQKYGWILFVIVVIFIVTAVSNSTNLTDGMDGLATGLSAIIGVTLGILAYVSGNVHYAGYLNIMYIPGIGEMLIFAGAMIGATIGFLWYNTKPAQIFMGDTGSLMLGGVIAVFAIAIRKELLIPILCGVFLVESLSVIMQTLYFKYSRKRRGKGERIFVMSPLHHHFQKGGVFVQKGEVVRIKKPYYPVPEGKLVVRFWIIGLILAALTLITLKIR